MEENNVNAVKQIEQMMTSAGMTLSDLISILGKQRSTTLLLSADKHTKFVQLYNDLENEDYSRYSKGELLEQLMDTLFSNTLFHNLRNCRTSTNEIDILVEWSTNARLADINRVFPCFGDTFICECKNYTAPVGVTYIGKFISLLITLSTSLGIMVAWNGITGRNSWTDSEGLIKKIALKKDIFIIVLQKDDLKRIYDQEIDILSLVSEKYTALKCDIDYTQFITKHEAEDALGAE
ncbi:MAG: hypothetical protein MR419_07525 [Clostridiales bacterium]|nr:hypothetical protein [Clostridiales bacterium]MDY4172963.1 hypothetical protein [Evtepia sp.]